MNQATPPAKSEPRTAKSDNYSVHDKVLSYIRERCLLRAGDRTLAAVSGGADSVALLRVLLELRHQLGITLAVAHFNHGLRGEQSAAEEAFVAELAKQHGLEFFVQRGDVREHAFTRKLSLEAAGRDLRYRWFGQLAQQNRFDCVATAHTFDDQAETVLLKLLRGAGTRGLAGIYPIVRQESFRIIRPLLCATRAEVETYLTSAGQPWREDESNLDHKFLRNRVRHELLPLLENNYNPNLRQSLNDLAGFSQAEEAYWDAVVQPYLTDHSRGENLSLAGFADLPLAMQRRVVKRFAETNGATLDFAHVEKLRRCALGELRATELPGGRLAICERGTLTLCAHRQSRAHDYEYLLPVPGEVYVPELDATVRALIVAEEFAREIPEDALLQRDLLASQLILRNWRHGDRYRPAHRGSEEKLKRLFAEKRIPVEQRAAWPVVLSRDEIVWAQTMPVAHALKWKGEGEAVRIDTVPGNVP